MEPPVRYPLAAAVEEESPSRIIAPEIRDDRDIVLALGELCKRVKSPSVEDDKKLDRLICYLRATRDQCLRLGCTAPLHVIVSIDAAFANRDKMRSATGMCVTLGTGYFITTSKVHELLSNTETIFPNQFVLFSFSVLSTENSRHT